MRHVLLALAALMLVSSTLIPAATDNPTPEGPTSIWLPCPEGVNIHLGMNGPTPNRWCGARIDSFKSKTTHADPKGTSSDQPVAAIGVTQGAGAIGGGSGTAMFVVE